MERAAHGGDEAGGAPRAPPVEDGRGLPELRAAAHAVGGRERGTPASGGRRPARRGPRARLRLVGSTRAGGPARQPDLRAVGGATATGGGGPRPDLRPPGRAGRR